MFIIHLGSPGFPFGLAQVKRTLLTYKSLKLAGCNPLIINKYSVFKNENINRIKHYEGIPYIITSFSKTRPDNFIVRNLNKISGYIGELILLFKKRKSIQAAIFYDSSFMDLVYYWLISKILRFKLIIHYVEYRSSIPEKNIFLRINHRFFDASCFYFCDGIIVISEFLKEKVIEKNKTLPILKIPAICDFSEFEFHEKVIKGRFLMYCGSISYMQVVDFIIELYCKLREMNLYNGNLVFALGVGEENRNRLKIIASKLQDCKYKDQIEVKINVPHKSLISLYLGAELLIAPMRNSIQDIAGFHHKIGEYAAAAKPIISNKAGELNHYFEDGISAILAEEYTVESYLSKLSERLPIKGELNAIAENGHKVGLDFLDYKVYSSKLKMFIINL